MFRLGGLISLLGTFLSITDALWEMVPDVGAVPGRGPSLLHPIQTCNLAVITLSSLLALCVLTGGLRLLTSAL